ncbi:hypothetical protein K2173_027254 [Erythroxylum novogranatense]|uniref:Secreted protein n=1 Tax=Erythroxylum novogranatense TaxID=1862640 RepID=A0AAV8TYJ5_9ROSI|nr:hypothetical protein K2173_027254 [Erythroxylum novogranatense]
MGVGCKFWVVLVLLFIIRFKLNWHLQEQFIGSILSLKAAYVHYLQGRKDIKIRNNVRQELNALDQLELGPVRTLFCGVAVGACTEAAAQPFEVVKR